MKREVVAMCALSKALWVAVLCLAGSGCSGLEVGQSIQDNVPVDAGVYHVHQPVVRGAVPLVPSELSGVTYGDSSFFTVHRDSAGRIAITQLAVDDWGKGKLRAVVQASLPYEDPEGLSYIDKTDGGAYRFVVAGERGHLSIVEMKGTALTQKLDLTVGSYDNLGIEGVCYYDGYAYYGIQLDGKLHRVRYDRQKGQFTGPVESVPSTAPSVRDLTAIGGGLYSLSGTQLTRVAGQGAPVLRIPFALTQPEGVTYAPDRDVVMVMGEPNEFGMYELGDPAHPG